MTSKKESFEWLKPSELPKDRLLKVVMKTPATTIHPDDPQYARRVFVKKELAANARSLINTRVGMNHEGVIMDSAVVDSEWNKKEEQLEGLLYVPKEIIKKVEEGKITQASIEYNWRDEKKTEEGVEFEGLHIFRIDLLEGKKAGDPNTSVTLMESKRQGRFLMEMVLEEGCVWSKSYASPEDCIAKNQDKEDPETYCHSKVETKKEDSPSDKDQPTLPLDTTPSTPETVDSEIEDETKPPIPNPADMKEPKPVCPEGWVYDEAVGCVAPEGFEGTAKCPEGYTMAEIEGKKVCAPDVKPAIDPDAKEPSAPKTDVVETPAGGEATPAELKEALRRVLRENKKLKESQADAIESAKEEAVEEVLDKIVEIIPNAFITSRFNWGARRLVEDLRKVLKEYQEE